ncbi:hypothetical protein, partial [Neisseria sicca]|uniref:hypothetical protein n=1 Tax=Neisseria sicca TaxID=490 RepID=UPI001C99DAA3
LDMVGFFERFQERGGGSVEDGGRDVGGGVFEGEIIMGGGGRGEIGELGGNGEGGKMVLEEGFGEGIELG